MIHCVSVVGDILRWNSWLIVKRSSPVFFAQIPWSGTFSGGRACWLEVENCIASKSYISHGRGTVRSGAFCNTGTIKLNSDGCARMDPLKAGFGGVFRNNKGDWILGYFGRLKNCSSVEAKIWGVYRGITTAFHRNWMHVVIECDSKDAVDIFQGNKIGPTSMTTQIMDGIYLIRRSNASINLICRDSNNVADAMANMGAEQDKLMEEITNPPDTVKGLLITDKLGTGMFM